MLRSRNFDMKPQVYFLCLLVLPLACARRSADTASPADEFVEDPATSTSEPPRPLLQESKKAGIVIAEEVAKMCDIPTTHFDFDSSSLDPAAERALNELADCFVDGPAADKGMRLLGHADPRGTEEYNLALGQRRAGNVADYLQRQGLDEGKVETSSRGEIEAKGTDEESWALDRKVEIFLAENED